MTDDRWAVIGLARPRSPWFRDLTGWANAGLVPVDFLKCIGAAEVRARLAAGAPCSALVADADAPGLDRDLVAAVHATGGVVVLVTTRAGASLGLGADAVLTEPLDPARLVDALRTHAPPLRPTAHHSAAALDAASTSDGSAASGFAAVETDTGHDGPDAAPGWTGRTVAVLGGNGAGSSTVALALAQGLAHHHHDAAGAVALADLALGGHLAMYVDARDVVPGLQELVDLHRRGTPTRAVVRDHLFAVEARGHDLLLGLRRPRDWTALRTRALDATLSSLVDAYRHLVVDVDADLDGEAETGSADLEDRNARGRLAVARADVVVVVVDASAKGLHDGARVVRDVAERLDRPDRILPVVNRAPRGRRARAELAATLSALCGPALGTASPPFVELDRGLEAVHRQAAPLPRSIVAPVTAAVVAALASQPTRRAAAAEAPTRVEARR